MVGIKKKLILIGLIFFVSSNVFAGGPWTQKKDVGFFKLSEWWVVFDQHYTAMGNIQRNIGTGVFNTTLYGEYGLNDKWTGIVNVNVFARNYYNNVVSASTGEIIQAGEELNSLGDIDLGVKYGIISNGAKVPISASVYLGIPSGATNQGSLGNLQTGDGEFNQMIQVDAGSSWNLKSKASIYLTAFAGINNRTNNFSDELRYGGELGLGILKDRLWVVGRLYIVDSFKNGSESVGVNPIGIYSNNIEFGSMSIELNGYVTKRVGLSVGNATAFHGELIAAKPSFTAGIFYDLSKSL